MKNLKRKLFIISLIATSSVAFSSCNFLDSFRSKNNDPDNEEEIKEETFEDKVENAKKSLTEYPDYSLYRKAEQKIVEDIVKQGVTALSNCTSVDVLNYLLEFYIEKIDAIVTKDNFPYYQQDEFLDLIDELVDEINSYKKLSDYRSAEKEIIKALLKEAEEKLRACQTNTTLYNTFNEYKGKLDEVKTDNDYILEEEDVPKLDDCNGTQQSKAYEEQGYKSIYKDLNYKDGYIVTKSAYGAGESPYHDKYLNTYQTTKSPTWTIAQWSTRYDIMSNDEETGGYTLDRELYGLKNTYTSKGKTVNGKFVPGKIITANSYTGELYFESNCSVEYEKHRTGSEPWVHLLYSQDFGDDLTFVKDTSSIIMDAEFTVEKFEDHMGSAFDTNKHAAQVVWYITIQNRNINSKGYGKYIWFGIGLWDNRTAGKKSGSYIAHDAGTDTLIYNPESNLYYANTAGVTPKVGERGHAHIEIRSIIEKAFSDAQKSGYLSNTNFEDLAIGGTNFGYEIPGTYDIGTSFHCINVFAK